MVVINAIETVFLFTGDTLIFPSLVLSTILSLRQFHQKIIQKRKGNKRKESKLPSIRIISTLFTLHALHTSEERT